MTGTTKMTTAGAELLQAVKQMKAGEKGRVYTPEQLLAQKLLFQIDNRERVHRVGGDKAENLGIKI